MCRRVGHHFSAEVFDNVLCTGYVTYVTSIKTKFLWNGTFFFIFKTVRAETTYLCVRGTYFFADVRI